MNLFKGMMLGAAAVATATTAQAADLPVAPEPVDYVRICDAYGARFYYIPGTETCLRVGGRVRTQIQTGDLLGNDSDYAVRNNNGYSWLARGSVRLDARTATEMGTLRAYVAIDADATNGTNTNVKLDNGFIQWGGLVSGRLGSNFDIFTGQAFIGSANRDWSDTTLNQLAYTAAFGNGFSVTAALEDGTSRRVGLNGTASIYGGTRMPDVVGALAVSQGWGSAQLSGAVRQLNPNSAYGDNHGYGWALGAGVGFNLDMLSSGSNIFFQGFYADGAMSYIGASSTERGGTVVDFNAAGSKSKGWSLSSGIYYQATSTIGLALDGSYMDVDNAVGTNDFNKWAIDGSVAWTPVSGLSIGADVGYSSTDVKSASNTDDLRFGVRMERSF
ncbi:MAG: porin [Roseibium sp.]